MRVRKGAATRRARKRIMKAAAGNVMGRRKLYRTVKETLMRARAFGFAHRRLKKRDFRALWIIRVSAACEARGVSYSQFIHGLKVAQIDLNRKMLSELAIHSPAVFDQLVELAKTKASVAA